MSEPALAPSATMLATRYGQMRTLGQPDDLIEHFLREYGEWASFETRFVAGAMPDGARVADVGAFVGTFGLGLTLDGRPESICFVEANPNLAPLLRDNIVRNTAVATTVVEAVLIPSSMRGGVSGKVETGNTGSLSVQAGEMPGRVSASVAQQQLTLGELRAEYGPFDLIKLDIEGLENAVLQDEFGSLASGGTSFWLECSNRAGSLALGQTLLEAGLDIYYFAFPVFSPNNYNGSTNIIFPWAFEAGLWATKRGAPPVAADLLEAGCMLRRIRSVAELKQALWDTPRWAPADWAGCAPATAVARAAHALLGDRFERYLSADESGSEPGDWVEPLPRRMKRKIEQLRGDLERAQSRVRAGEVMLQAERNWLQEQCDHFSYLQAELAAARADHSVAQTEIQLQKDEVARLALQLNEIQSSNLFHMMLALRAAALRHPGLFRAVRPVLRFGWRTVRRLRGR
ncbi:MAG: FkbM family methyltransferase [Acetobacteraceae bacterium]|nr:FkbM family methyltransferase [Acetobacteraceae bacterium]